MRIVLLYEHHRRVVGERYRRAFRSLGHEVTSIGPWDDGLPLGWEGCRPDYELSRRHPHLWYEWHECSRWLTAPADLVVLMDHGEDFQVQGIPEPWVHHCFEGTHHEWSDTPYKSVGIERGADTAGIEWLPNGYDPTEHFSSAVRLRGVRLNVFDLAHFAVSRRGREHVYGEVRRALDLRTASGELWGMEYGNGLRRSMATWVCVLEDFIPNRVWDAMACGCVLIANRRPALQRFFREGEHFIGFDAVRFVHDELIPDPEWLIATVRRLREQGDGGMAARAYEAVLPHSYAARAQRMIAKVFP